MRLEKYRDGDKYVLKFEITMGEAAAGEVDIEDLWRSKKLVDFIDALNKMTKPKEKTNPFENIFRGRRPGGSFNTNNPFENLRRAKGFGQNFDPNFGSFSQEELNDYMRREQARQQASGWAGFNGSTQPGFKPVANWAKVLELPETATKDEIRARYRELAKKHHPDRGGDAAKFAKITEAYDQAMAVKS